MTTKRPAIAMGIFGPYPDLGDWFTWYHNTIHPATLKAWSAWWGGNNDLHSQV